MTGVLLPLALFLGVVTLGVLLLRNRTPAAELAAASGFGEDLREDIFGRCPLCGGLLDARAVGSPGIPGQPGSGGVHDEVYCPACGIPEREARERREAGLW
jgi:hypothetical protein